MTDILNTPFSQMFSEVVNFNVEPTDYFSLETIKEILDDIKNTYDIDLLKFTTVEEIASFVGDNNGLSMFLSQFEDEVFNEYPNIGKYDIRNIVIDITNAFDNYASAESEDLVRNFEDDVLNLEKNLKILELKTDYNDNGYGYIKPKIPFIHLYDINYFDDKVVFETITPNELIGRLVASDWGMETFSDNINDIIKIALKENEWRKGEEIFTDAELKQMRIDWNNYTKDILKDLEFVQDQ